MSASPIKSTKDMKLDYAKVVCYGPPGAGKTTMGATFPDVLFLSAESGLLSIRDHNIDVWEINEWEDVEAAFAFLKKGGHKYKSVVIDSMTELQKKYNDYLIKKFPTVQRAYKNMTSQSDWGANIDAMRRFCRAMRDLPMNVLFIALAQEMDLDGDAIVRPALSGKTLPDELCGWVDAVIYCPGPQAEEESGETRYIGQTVAAKGRRAKVRVPAGSPVPAVIPLSYAALHKAMFPDLYNEKKEAK